MCPISDQELISYCYLSWSYSSSKKPEARFKLDWYEIWQDRFSSKYPSNDRSWTFDLMSEFQDGGHDVILCRSAADWRVNMKHKAPICAYAEAHASS